MEQIISTFIKELFHQPPIFWIIVGSGILLAIFHNKIMGYMGEFWVNRELNKLPKDKYRILKDIMIKIDDRTCQIDHIVVSHYGIFVIETKNYSGLITGSSKSEKWCMHLGKNKYYFHNPLYQNYGHIKALESLLNINFPIYFQTCVTAAAPEYTTGGDDANKLNIIQDNTIIAPSKQTAV